MSGKGILGNFCLTLVSLSIACGVAEAVLRIVGYTAWRDLENGRELILQPSPHPDVKYEFRPGASGYVWHTQMEINAHGHRGRMGSPGPFAGFRIIALGDSITVGNFLPLEATYAYQMQEMLDKTASQYEVLNFGVGGYDVLQDVTLLEYRGLTYKPDLVVVGFCLNDVGIASPNLQYIERVQQYKANPLLSTSRLAQFIVQRVERRHVRLWMEEKNQLDVFAKDYEGKIAPIADDEEELHALMHRLPAEYPSIWYSSALRVGRLRYAFERLAALATNEKFSVVVTIVPWLVAYAHVYPHQFAHAIISREAHRVGFDVLEIVQEFMDAGMDSLKITTNDLIHPNATGHSIVATKLVQYVYDTRHTTTIPAH